MTRKDKDALKRALVMVETVDAEIAQRIKAHSTWQEAAERAAFFCQMRLLHLRPWMTPPMLSHDQIDPQGGYGGTEQEVGLRRKMLALGLSLYEPNPLAAIAEAEAKTAIAEAEASAAEPAA